MKKISLLLILLVLLLCGCSQMDIPLPGVQTSQETTDQTPLQTTPHEHFFQNEVVTREARCTEVGFKTATCACGATEETLIPATGHTFGEAVVTKQPTCIETGEKTITCSACGATEKTSISATGKHIYGEAVVTTEPTCVKDGEKTAACTTCDAIEKTTVPATGKHIYGEAVVTKQPTCIETGEKTITCSACGATEKTTVPATGKHIYGEAVVTTEPTCAEDGEKTATCITCNATEKTTIPATEAHLYENGLCSVCGDSPIPLYPVPSVYDADGDGQNDIYNFSPKLLDTFKNGIHIWAKNYLSGSSPSTSSTGGYQHWYVQENQNPAQSILYSVTVPEAGEYEMVIHVRMKDAQERGTKYTINAGTAYEYVFETSFGYEGMNYIQLCDVKTSTSYMYGIKVNLVAGENIIKIEQSSQSPKCQHYRDFYFVKTGEFHLHHYENETVTKEVTCGADGEKIATCSCGKVKTTVIPATENHIYVDGICTGCGKEYVPMGILEYNFLYDNPGFAGGTLTFLPETSDVYTFYWADENGRLKDYTMLYSDEFFADMEAEVTIQSFTAIPKGATRLIAISGDGDVSYSYTIPTSRLFTEEELYVFGALSDTHQGTRYGSADIPYDHFINASESLYEKGAITIGICGDFTYENIESEYILHANAIREIYGFAPDMPIFTTTGNHESRPPYPFNEEMYLKYTRGLVDYDSDLYYIFSDGNTLDYVIELPDGSVMIFFHQVKYEYGSSTSRLVTDAQLDWLGERFEQYKDRTVFFFFHTYMDEQVGDASSIGGGEYGLPMISSTVDYKRLDAYFKQYTNVVYFSGHSHLPFDSQFVTPKPGETNYDKNIDDKDGTYATMVHIPSCAAPRVLSNTSSGLSDAPNRSEGYIVYVYEDCIVFMGYDFVNGETFAYATYIIEK